MTTHLRITVLGALSLIAGILLADDAQKRPVQAEPLKIERVVPAGSLIGTELGSKEDRLGVVNDYVIDFRAGQVALIVVVNSQTPVDIGERAAVPFAAVAFDGKAWHLKPSVDDKQLAVAKRVAHETANKAFHRESVRELYQAFGCEPYWEVTKIEKYDPREQLSLWSNQREIRLLDSDDAVAGDIEDFGISPDNGLIAYAAVDMGQAGVARNFLYAIPLSAFVAPDAGKPWKIELTQLELRERESFPRDKWIKEVPRGWVEYVHVRYGNSELSGVQTETKSPENQDR